MRLVTGARVLAKIQTVMTEKRPPISNTDTCKK
uniref:Uncharacterized protein n=1 Tax=Rhizophora mucronata TaxID=61149 RepID=A0A2P2NAJ5_RHIMU